MTVVLKKPKKPKTKKPSRPKKPTEPKQYLEWHVPTRVPAPRVPHYNSVTSEQNNEIFNNFFAQKSLNFKKDNIKIRMKTTGRKTHYADGRTLEFHFGMLNPDYEVQMIKYQEDFFEYNKKKRVYDAEMAKWDAEQKEYEFALANWQMDQAKKKLEAAKKKLKK